MEAILRTMSTDEDKKISYQMTLYSGVAHGFATRADLSDERQRWAKEEAAMQAIRWMDRFVKGA